MTGSTPADGAIVPDQLTSYTITFSQAIDPTSLDPSDLTVNSIPADQVTLSPDGLTATFTYAASPITVPGVQTIAMAADSVSESGATTVGNRVFSAPSNICTPWTRSSTRTGSTRSRTGATCRTAAE